MEKNPPPSLDNDSVSKKSSEISQQESHPRYRWIDQFRGVYLVFFFIASLTTVFSKKILDIEFPIGPTWLNFGYNYADFYPRMITLVDLGSQVFMYILGLTLTISFRRKLEAKGSKYAWISIFTRVCVFFWIALVMYTDYVIFNVNDIVLLVIWAVVTITVVILRNTRFKNTDLRLIFGFLWSISSMLLWYFKFDSNIWTIFFGNSLAYFAWATLVGAVCVYLIRKPDYRIIIPICLMGMHFFLWEKSQSWSIPVLSSTLFEFPFMVPFDVLGLISVAITATCVWDWMNMDPKDHKVGIRKRVVPLMSITFIGQYVIDFFQTADSEGTDTSIVFLGIALSCAFCMLAKAIDLYYDFNSRVLTSLGKNGLFLLIFQSVLIIPYRLIWPNGGQDFRKMVSLWLEVSTTHALVNLMGILAFLIPMIILAVSAWILDKFKIYVRI